MNPRHVLCVLAVALLSGWSPASAREFDVGGPTVLRFDNTVRYNLGIRTDPINSQLGADPRFVKSETAFGQGSLSANRLDLLSELDATYEDRLGARLSAAAWFDQAYVGKQLSDYSTHRYRGPWGELLDAFVFARTDVWGMPVTLKAGRHAVSWGESLMLGGAIHGVSYSQMPLDLQKGFATPGVEAKELFRPLTNLSMQAQVTPTVSVAAQYFLEWQSYLYPEGYTFLGASDFPFNGPDSFVGPGGVVLDNGGVSEPRNAGEWGAALRWAPEMLDGTLGLYYRHYTDKLAAVLMVPTQSLYRQFYGEGIDLAGVSFAKQVLGVSIGAEASYRHDTPLVARPLKPVTPDAQLIGNTYQARGDTFHAVLNAVGILSRVPGFSMASWAMEVTYSRWLTVRDNASMFFGEGFGECDPALGPAARTRDDGCSTRDAVAVSFGFTPTWLRVFSGVDFLAPLFVSWNIHGNSPVTMGGNEASGTFGVGVAADVKNNYRFDLRYVDYFGNTGFVEGVPTPVSFNGQLALLQNRGSVIATAKATF